MPKLSKRMRVRMILDLLEDGEVQDSSAYDNVELCDPAKTQKYVDALVGNQLIGPEELTNDQKAQQALRQLKQFFRSALHRKKTHEAQQAARAEAEAELEADFVDDEQP